MSENDPKKAAETSSASAPAVVRDVYRYECFQADDGCCWIRLLGGKPDADGNLTINRYELGILPLRFSSDLKVAAEDLTWTLNKARMLLEPRNFET